MHDQKNAQIIKDEITSHFTSTPACIPERIAPFICENKDNEDKELFCIVSELHGEKARRLDVYCVIVVSGLFSFFVLFFVHHRIETPLNSVVDYVV